MTEFELIKEMREAIVNEKTSFQEYLDNYCGGFSRKELGQAWAKACSLIKEDKWKCYLIERSSRLLGDFANCMEDLFETGLDCPDIGASLGIDSKIVRAFL